MDLAALMSFLRIADEFPVDSRLVCEPDILVMARFTPSTFGFPLEVDAVILDFCKAAVAAFKAICKL